MDVRGADGRDPRVGGSERERPAGRPGWLDDDGGVPNVPIAVVDASTLYATVDASDAGHERCRGILEASRFRFIVPVMAVAEVTYLVARNLGSVVEAAFLRGMQDFEIEAPLTDEWNRIAELVRQYRDIPLGGTDASVIALAERLNTDLLITLDRRHFGAVRPRHVPAIRILPD